MDTVGACENGIAVTTSPATDFAVPSKRDKSACAPKLLTVADSQTPPTVCVNGGLEQCLCTSHEINSTGSNHKTGIDVSNCNRSTASLTMDCHERDIDSTSTADDQPQLVNNADVEPLDDAVVSSRIGDNDTNTGSGEPDGLNISFNDDVTAATIDATGQATSAVTSPLNDTSVETEPLTDVTDPSLSQTATDTAPESSTAATPELPPPIVTTPPISSQCDDLHNVRTLFRRHRNSDAAPQDGASSDSGASLGSSGGSGSSDDICDCDTCLLGFDDTQADGVAKSTKRKSAVNK